MSEQLQNTGVGYWACRACSAYAANMNRRMKQIEDRLEQCSKETETNKETLKVMDSKVEKICEELKKKDEKTEKLVKQGESNVYEEMRERELRRLNVVFFKIPELNEKNATGKDKMEWDKKSCCNVFSALELDLGEKSIKFCRRVGEKGEEPRPLVTGFWTEMERAMLLREAKKLEKTVFSDISVTADLTKIQRDEEKDMKKEADKRNAQLSEQDKSKNLRWMVVGARGEKRFVKAVPRDQPAQRGRPTVRGRGTRGTRGGGVGGRTSGANNVPIGARPPQAPVITETESETETEAESDPGTEKEMESETETERGSQSTTERATIRGKRKGSGGRAADAPPEKR